MPHYEFKSASNTPMWRVWIDGEPGQEFTSLTAAKAWAQHHTYLEAFRSGIKAALCDVDHKHAARMAAVLPYRESEGFLAGYYAEKRKRRFEADSDAVDTERGHCIWTKP